MSELSDRDPLDGTPYVSVGMLGRGGMGEVRLARHRLLGKEVVVKLLHEELIHPRLADRMRVEAQSLAKLKHPHIVDVLDLGTTPTGRPFLAMERLIGETLADRLRRAGALTPQEAGSHVLDILDALSAAHAIGVVHRDVKGENVFLHHEREKTVVKLLDFGVAKILDGSDGVAPPRFGTEEGTLIGTPRFCSPEQIAGAKDIDHRADLYSVGALLFLLLTGRRPFEHPTLIELMRAHAHERPPPPSTLARQPISPQLDGVVLCALEKRPRDRFSSAMEMATALRAALVVAAPSRTVRLTAQPAPARKPRQGTDLMEDPTRAPTAGPSPTPGHASSAPAPSNGARQTTSPLVGAAERQAPEHRQSPEHRPGPAPAPLVEDRRRFALVFGVVLVAVAVVLGVLWAWPSLR